MSKLEQAARQALEALETLDSGDSYKTHNAAAALREALAEQAEQEDKDLVAQMNIDVGLKQKVYEALAEQAEQSGGPVGVIGWAANIPNTMEEVHWEDECPPIGTTLYAAPVRTVDLTDDEISKIWYDSSYGDSGIDFARAVIAADREKNQWNS